MKSITIHNLDETLARLIQRKAKREHLSLNKTIQKLLRVALGLSEKDKSHAKEEFSDLCGVWSQKEAREFAASQKDFDVIDPEDWA